MSRRAKQGGDLLASAIGESNCIPAIQSSDAWEAAARLLDTMLFDLEREGGDASSFCRALEPYYDESSFPQVVYVTVASGVPGLRRPLAAVGTIKEAGFFGDGFSCGVGAVIVIAAPNAATTRRMIRAFSKAFSVRALTAVPCAKTPGDLLGVVLGDWDFEEPIPGI